MQDKEFEQQLRRQDVQLLITQLMKNEETTIKLILERLYDTGTENWIDQKVSWRLVNRGAKVVARCAKPAGRYFGYRWLVQKTPRLIVGWLFRQVAFKPQRSQPVTAEVQPAPPALLMQQQQRITQLQNRLRLTSGVAVLSVISMGGVIIFQNADVLTQALPRPFSPQEIDSVRYSD